MTAKEAYPFNPNQLKTSIAAELERDSLLVPEHGVELRLASSEYAEPVAALYRAAFARGDYFASRYIDPINQIFSPEWLRQEFSDPEHLRFVFTDSEGGLLGATGFFHDRDAASRPLMTSDATQIALGGRGEHIMDHFFRRIVPVIEASGEGIITDFVLTPESKGLRRTLESELGLVALGIHPHALYHRDLAITRSEISAAKYPILEPQQARLVEEFEPIFRIVQTQMPLPEPAILEPENEKWRTLDSDRPYELVRPVDASDPKSQKEALAAGWTPSEYDPERNLFKVSKFPSAQPELDFIITSEDVPANKLLVRYLKEIMYAQISAQEFIARWL